MTPEDVPKATSVEPTTAQTAAPPADPPKSRKPRRKKVTASKDDEPFYPKLTSLVPRRRPRKAEEEDDDYSPPEAKRARRTRGIKLDYHALHEGDVFFGKLKEKNDTITNWTKTKAERELDRSREEDGGWEEGDEEAREEEEGEEEEKEEDERIKTTKIVGQCKVCGLEEEMEMRMPYCKAHAEMFAAFKRKQLERLRNGHVD